jgi:hypothetical protein
MLRNGPYDFIRTTPVLSKLICCRRLRNRNKRRAIMHKKVHDRACGTTKQFEMLTFRITFRIRNQKHLMAHGGIWPWFCGRCNNALIFLETNETTNLTKRTGTTTGTFQVNLGLLILERAITNSFYLQALVSTQKNPFDAPRQVRRFAEESTNLLVSVPE